MAVPHRPKHLRLDPLAVGEHALFVAARAEVPGLAGVCELVVVPTGVEVDAGKAAMRVAALEVALDDLCFDRAAQPAEGAQFRPVALRALQERARTRGCAGGISRPAPAQGHSRSLPFLARSPRTPIRQECVTLGCRISTVSIKLRR